MTEDERREKKRARDARYRERNRERLREKDAARRSAIPEDEAARSARYRERNPAKRSATIAKYYAGNREHELQRSRARLDREYSQALETAGRRGEVWTSAEDAIVMDRTQTIKAIALRLRRTTFAVSRRRGALVAGERERAASVAAAHAEAESRMRP